MTSDLKRERGTSHLDRDTATELERRRTGVDVVVGILMLIAGAILLGNVVFATVVSVLLLGWTALVSGVVLIVGTLLRLRSGASWTVALGGVVLAVLGLFILRNPAIGALTLTLLGGSMFLTTGLVRVFGAWAVPGARVPLVVSGLISTGLGLWVLLNLTTATLTLLGTLLALQTLLEGATMLAVGRLRPVAGPVAPSGAPSPA
ncbi:HdeD family acid-resistance protein [Modestobacter sp. SSW1-42]|uniref:HdeD family acid-resistance protein n=1 Tax=Modestobacter sp. SSW1-42 TaxID=596372 RepID=UPI003987B64B